MLFIDNPVGAGFSFTPVDAGYCTDTKGCVARNLYSLLQQFYHVWPEYQRRELYITGESYGGHYVPSLAAAIVEGNAGPEWINLKGFLVGNAWTAPKLDNEGAADYWASHGLVSGATVAQMKKDCDFNIIGPLRAGDGECDALVASAMDEMGDINIYQVYADVCHAAAETQVAQLAKHAFMLGAARPKPAEKYAPCVEN